MRTHGRAMRICRKTEQFHLLEPCGIQTSMGGSRHTYFRKAKKCPDGDEHIENQDGGKRATVPSVNAEPKMQAKREMAPDEKDKKDLAEPCPGINPEVGDFVRVIDVDAGENACPAVLTIWTSSRNGIDKPSSI